MTKLDDFDNELVDRLRESTANFIKSVEIAYEEELPTRAVYVPKDGKIIEKNISNPRPILGYFRDKGGRSISRNSRVDRGKS